MADSALQQLRIEAYRRTDSKWPRAWIAAIILATRRGPAYFAEIADEASKYNVSSKTVQRGLRELERLGIVKRGEHGEYILHEDYKALIRAVLMLINDIEKFVNETNKEDLEKYENIVVRLKSKLRDKGMLNWFTENIAEYLTALVSLAKTLVEERIKEEEEVKRKEQQLLHELIQD